MTPATALVLRALLRPLLAFGLVIAAIVYHAHLRHAIRDAEAGEAAAIELANTEAARADRAETQARLDTAAAAIGANREVEIRRVASPPVVRTRLVRVCEQTQPVRTADATGVEPARSGADAGDRQADLDGLAADIAACKANAVTLNAHVRLLDEIYAHER